MLCEGPELVIAIYHAVTKFGAQSTQLDRLRNQVASDITTINAIDSSGKGRVLLWQLLALAPDAGGEEALLGVKRAVFLVQHLEQWALADEDLSQDTQNVVTAVLFHLAPILQGVAGGHWDFACDIIESNLEVIANIKTITYIFQPKYLQECSLRDDHSYFELYWSLNLILLLDTLSKSNANLRQYWEARNTAIMRQACELILQPPRKDYVSDRSHCTDITAAGNSKSEPQTICLTLALQVAQLIPSSLLKPDLLDPVGSN